MNKFSQISSPNSLRRQPKQERGQQRVIKILTAAAEVFAEVGYGRLTLDGEGRVIANPPSARVGAAPEAETEAAESQVH